MRAGQGITSPRTSQYWGHARTYYNGFYEFGRIFIAWQNVNTCGPRLVFSIEMLINATPYVMLTGHIMLQTPASLVLVLAEVALTQVSHHIYSLTDLMATDSLGGGHGGHLYTVTVTPPPGFLASRASGGPFVTARAASSSRGPFVTSRPAFRQSPVTPGSASAQHRVFLPTPLPSRAAPKPPQQKSSKPGKSKKGETTRVC